MFFDIVKRNSLSWIRNEDLGEKISEDWAHCFCVCGLTLRYFFINSFWIVSSKWRCARNYLHHQDTKAPNIDFGPMLIASSQNLRSDICWSSTICIGPTVLTFQLLGKTEINEFDMTPLQHRDNDVFWLEIPVKNIVWVQILQSQQHLCSIIRHILLYQRIEFTNFAQHGAPLDVF